MAGLVVHNVENAEFLLQVKAEAAEAAKQLAEAAKLHRGQIVVVGCSTSEVISAFLSVCFKASSSSSVVKTG